MKKDKIKEGKEQEEKDSHKFSCNGCGAYLKYKPGTQHLDCEYCGAINEIETSNKKVTELNYLSHLTDETEKKVEASQDFIKCESCACTITLSTTISSALCPYCSTPLIIEKAFKENAIQPKSLLPFKFDTATAKTEFKKWIGKLWFAPNNLGKTLNLDNLNGIYIPYWTYDTNTISKYTGKRGEYYYVTESYTTTENGKSVTRTRQVRHTRWHSTSGTVSVSFDDILVTATRSVPEKHLQNLEPWDLENLVPFNKSYLSGYVSEKYQINLEEGFEIAKKISEDRIRNAIRRDIGGDEQRIYTVDTRYLDIKFKHLLLPVYLSVYKYGNKVYQFFINARTGEVEGERPYSWIKITLTILLALGIISSLVYYFGYYQK